jgi:hypothetical protein
MICIHYAFTSILNQWWCNRPLHSQPTFVRFFWHQCLNTFCKTFQFVTSVGCFVWGSFCKSPYRQGSFSMCSMSSIQSATTCVLNQWCCNRPLYLQPTFVKFDLHQCLDTFSKTFQLVTVDMLPRSRFIASSPYRQRSFSTCSMSSIQFATTCISI